MTKVTAKNFAKAVPFLNSINTSATRNRYNFSSKQAVCIPNSIFILDLERNCSKTAVLIGISNFLQVIF